MNDRMRMDSVYEFIMDIECSSEIVQFTSSVLEIKVIYVMEECNYIRVNSDR